MKPITCATCGFFIGSIVIEYETKMKEICDNIKLSPEEQSDEIVKLIKKLNIKRYCCKMRLVTQKDIVNDVLPVSN